MSASGCTAWVWQCWFNFTLQKRKDKVPKTINKTVWKKMCAIFSFWFEFVFFFSLFLKQNMWTHLLPASQPVLDTYPVTASGENPKQERAKLYRNTIVFFHSAVVLAFGFFAFFYIQYIIFKRFIWISKQSVPDDSLVLRGRAWRQRKCLISIAVCHFLFSLVCLQKEMGMHIRKEMFA